MYKVMTRTERRGQMQAGAPGLTDPAFISDPASRALVAEPANPARTEGPGNPTPPTGGPTAPTLRTAPASPALQPAPTAPAAAQGALRPDTPALPRTASGARPPGSPGTGPTRTAPSGGRPPGSRAASRTRPADNRPPGARPTSDTRPTSTAPRPETVPAQTPRRPIAARRPQLPDAFAERLVAVLSGRHPVHSMLRHTAGHAYDELIRLAERGPLRTRGPAPVVRDLGYAIPREGAVEAFARVGVGERVRAMAFRLELGPDRRWRCTALELDGPQSARSG